MAFASLLRFSSGATWGQGEIWAACAGAAGQQPGKLQDQLDKHEQTWRWEWAECADD